MAIAGIFPGQGSQSLGMLSDLAACFPDVKQTFEQASDVINKDLWNIITSDSKTELNQTINTQPIMLAAGIAVWKVWLSQGGCKPIGMAGHSLGEYSALVASGCLDFATGIALVTQRADLMQNAVAENEGAMAAILGLADEKVITACQEAAENEIVEAVNFNSPGQVVIAGHANAINRAIIKTKQAGAKRAIKLAVSVPSHCALMKPAAEELNKVLQTTEFTLTNIPVLHNVDCQSYQSAEKISHALSQQLYRPVRWVNTIQRFTNDFSVNKMVEFGPGKVLFGLNRRINRKIKTICVHDAASLEIALKLCED